MDRRIAKSGCGQGCLTIMPAKEGTQNREAGKAEQTRITQEQRKCRGIQFRTELDSGYSKALEAPQGPP